MQSRLSWWWVADGWANHQSSTIKDWSIDIEDSPPLSEDEAAGLAKPKMESVSLDPFRHRFQTRILHVPQVSHAIQTLGRCSGQHPRLFTFHGEPNFGSASRGNHQNQMRLIQLLWVKGELCLYYIYYYIFIFISFPIIYNICTCLMHQDTYIYIFIFIYTTSISMYTTQLLRSSQKWSKHFEGAISTIETRATKPPPDRLQLHWWSDSIE